MSFSVAYVSADEFGIFPGSGWAILENSKRIDWPMLATRAEAESDLRGFRKSFRQLAADEASEAHGFRMMGAV